MNIKIKKGRWSLLLFLLFSLPLLSACNDEDDVMDIFTGKVWKMSRLTAKGSSSQFPDLWGSDNVARQASLKLLEQENTYTIEFKAADVGEITGGNFSAKGVKASPTGTWSADGKDNSFTLNFKSINGSESDLLAKKFISGLQNAYKYEGDVNTLNIYFQEGQTTWLIGFTPKR